MKKPDAAGWVAIAIAVLSLILACMSYFADGKLTPDEAQKLSADVGKVVETVQAETAEAAE